MAPRATLIKDSDKKRVKIADKLKAKADKPKHVTLKQFVISLQAEIELMLSAGYNYEEVAEAFKAEGVDVKAATIRSYLPSKAKRKGSNDTIEKQSANNIDINTPKSKRGRKPKSATKSNSSQTSNVDVQAASHDAQLVNDDARDELDNQDTQSLSTSGQEDKYKQLDMISSSELNQQASMPDINIPDNESDNLDINKNGNSKTEIPST